MPMFAGHRCGVLPACPAVVSYRNRNTPPTKTESTHRHSATFNRNGILIGHGFSNPYAIAPEVNRRNIKPQEPFILKCRRENPEEKLKRHAVKKPNRSRHANPRGSIYLFARRP